MPKHMLASDYGIVPHGGRGCRWPASENQRTVEETSEDGASITVGADLNGRSP